MCRFRRVPENMRNLTFSRFDENLKKTRKKRVFWTFKKRGTTMWWLPPNYLLFRYPVWPPNYVGGYSGTPPKRGGLVRGPPNPETREIRVSGCSAKCAFLHRNGIPVSGSGFQIPHPVIPMGWVVAENLPSHISGLRTLLKKIMMIMQHA